MLHVTVFCFLASYLVAFALELGRLLGRSAISRFVMVGFGIAGFVAHTLYLVNRSQQTHLPPLLASTHDWMLVLAWVLVLFYVFLTIAQKELAVGLFALPVVLIMVGSAYFLSQEPNVTEINTARAQRAWTILHAASIVFGMTAGAAGFLSGLMYLIQHRRLKTHHGEQTGLKMPSLARLAQFNRWSILLTFLLLTLGFASGVFLAVVPQAQKSSVRFSDPAVIGSGVVWLFLAGLFVKLLTGRSSAGRQVAWLTIAGCGFLLLTVIGLQVVTGSIHSYSSSSALPKEPRFVAEFVRIPSCPLATPPEADA
ncbi:MAG: cytochrome c biogenesis protein CcsA [Planctomycetia bacterium]|nr:cytochrome c biogenesis protein CcsA [Planctomycetia bacterium]